MSIEKPVLIIERLSVFTAFVALTSYRKYQNIFFVHQTKIIKTARVYSKKIDAFFKGFFTQLDNIDFLGLFDDYMEEATEYCNDRVYDQNKNNIYCNIARHFCGDERYSIVLQKELLNRYVVSRVKTFLILKKIAAQTNEIVFIPQDNEDIASTFSRPFTAETVCHIPAEIRWINAIRQVILKIFLLIALPFLLCGVVLKISRKGFTKTIPVRQYFRYGIDMQKNGLLGERGLDIETSKFFLYDDDEFASDKILHVVRLGHNLDDDARQLFETHHCPYVELEKLRIPLIFFFNRIIGDFCIGSLITSIKFLSGTNKNTIFILPALATIKMILDEEIINLHYSIKVFISRDDYSPYHIVRTIVANKSSNYTVGFQWADYSTHNSTFSHFVFDRYALWGDFFQEFYKRALSHSKVEIIGAGIYGSDTAFSLQQKGYYPEKYREIKKKNFVIGIMGSAFEPETSVTRGPANQFHKDVIELTDGYKGIFRILKPKTDWQDTELKEMIKNRDNLVLEKQLTTPRFLLVPDLIIVMSNSSVGLEALMAGKKVVYYSFVTPPRHQKISPYCKYMVAFTKDELKRILDSIITEGKYDDDAVVDQIRTKFGYKFDGKIAERLRGICRSLAEQ